MKYEIGDILFISSTGFDYKITDKDDRFYTLQKVKENGDLGRHLSMSQDDLENIFETIKQQRKSKLESLNSK